MLVKFFLTNILRTNCGKYCFIWQDKSRRTQQEKNMHNYWKKVGRKPVFLEVIFNLKKTFA